MRQMLTQVRLSENKVAADCLQLHGGWGYMMETPIARSYADARVQTIYGGTNEVMKELIARTIITKPRKQMYIAEKNIAVTKCNI